MEITKNNMLNIFICVFIIFGIIVLLDISGMNLNTKEAPKKLIQTVTIESMHNINVPSMDKHEDFCKAHEGATSELEKSCNKLTKNNCNEVSCCVYLNGNKCVAGNARGPIYKTETTGEKINVDYYYYKNKCYGNCA
jgi:hypothetical protein